MRRQKRDSVIKWLMPISFNFLFEVSVNYFTALLTALFMKVHIYTCTACLLCSYHCVQILKLYCFCSVIHLFSTNLKHMINCYNHYINLIN